MGSKSHLTPRAYSLRFNRFLERVIVEQKGGRAEARWAEVNMPGPPDGRGKDYWAKLLKGKQAMTTEDISLVADWLDVSPMTFVRAVHEDDIALVAPPSNVVPLKDYDLLRDLQIDTEATPEQLAALEETRREDEGTTS